MKRTLTIAMASMLVFSVTACGDDSTGDNNNTVNCTDADGDGYGVGADCAGADCNDADAACWEGACCNVDCTDADGDGYGVGVDCMGADCDDTDVACWEGACCGDCADLDGDGYGNGVDCLGTDCNDSDPLCWVGACCGGSCTDADGDTYGVGTDCAGPDCNDNDDQCWTPGDACCPAAGDGNVGDACTDATQCTNVNNGTAECLTSVVVINFPGGYCSGSGCTPGQACDATGNSVCVDLYGYFQYCLVECTAASECRQAEGYDCTQLPQAPVTDPMYCLPAAGP